jgi:hypothetical protein
MRILINKGGQIGGISMRKSEQICARVTPEVMASLRVSAERESLLLSEFVRRTLLEKLSQMAACKPLNQT